MNMLGSNRPDRWEAQPSIDWKARAEAAEAKYARLVERLRAIPVLAAGPIAKEIGEIYRREIRNAIESEAPQ